MKKGVSFDRRTLSLLGAVLLIVPLTGCVAGSSKTDDPFRDLRLESGAWTTHVGLGKPEPDVYIDGEAGEGVTRPTPADAAKITVMDAPLYASAKTQAHDPSFTVLGPFVKGDPLGVTLAEWVAAEGTWAYACRPAGPGIFQATLDGLVPEGLYSLWLERVRLNEGDLEASTWSPLGGFGGSNTFWSDGAGDATVRVELPECLPTTELSATDTGIVSQVVAILHSDGATYGEFPGAFGKNAHTHLATRVTGGPVL